MRRKKRAQSVVEYLALMAIIIGAFIGAGTYFKRGIQGRWKSSVDGVGDQYDPRVADTDVVDSVSSSSETRITTIPVNGGIWTMRTDGSIGVDAKIGSSSIAAF
jgi:hypothetical protein